MGWKGVLFWYVILCYRNYQFFSLGLPLWLKRQPWHLKRQLINFFNGKDHTNPPQWDIKLFTQSFINIISANEGKIFKIDRKLNIMAHVLASQTYKSTVRTSDEFHATCTNPLHVNSCLAAIYSGLGESFTLIAASLQSTLATSQQSST